MSTRPYRGVWKRDDAGGTPVIEAAYKEMDTWRQSATSLDVIGVFSSVNWPLTLLDGDVRSRLAYVAVSAPFFEVVGVAPGTGRPLDERDEAGNEARVAVISDQLWRQRFGATRDIIGADLRVQEDVESPVRALEVVGLMPPAIDFPRGAQPWVPAQVCARSHSAPARTPEAF